MARPGEREITEEERLVDEARAREGLDRDIELDDLRAILADQRVRDFLWRLMGRAGMFTSPFNPNAAIMGHNAGLGDMGRAIYGEIMEADPEAWILMQQDALKRQRVAEAIHAQQEEERIQSGRL